MLQFIDVKDVLIMGALVIHNKLNLLLKIKASPKAPYSSYYAAHACMMACL